MIVSHARKFIFIKTKKTAGTSLEIALSKYCGPDDILTPLVDYDEKTRVEVAGSGARNYNKRFAECSTEEKLRRLVKRKATPKYNEHMAAVDIRQRLGERVWNEYFKFTIVRNPFDRAISRYFWSLNNDFRYPQRWNVTDFNQFLRYFPDFVNENWKIYTEGDRVMVDDVLKYETLEHDLARVSRAIGLDHNLHDDFRGITTKAGIRPKSGQASAMIGPAERVIIESLCCQELALFGYRLADLL